MVSPHQIEKLRNLISQLPGGHTRDELSRILPEIWKSHTFEQQVRLLIEDISIGKMSTEEGVRALIQLHQVPMKENNAFNID